MTRSLATFALAASLSLVACTSDESGPDPAEKQKQADAERKKAEAEALAEAERKGREAQAAREAERIAKLDAIAADVVKLPDPLPKTLDDACTEVIENYGDWVKAVYFDDDRFQIEFFDSKKANLGKVKGKCAHLESLEASACMASVVKGVAAEGAYTEDQRKLIQNSPDYLFEACVAKFAPDKQ